MGKFVSTGVSGGEVVSVLPLPVTTQRTWTDKMFKAKLQAGTIIHMLGRHHSTRKHGVK
jgi:hypothetical protein